MRDFLNAIMAWIGQTSLTDLEYGTVDQDGLTVSVYNQALYAQLSLVLDTRDAVSSAQERLVAFFNSKGVEVTEVVSAGKSQIYLGDAL